jgi:transposase-like protein
MEQEKRTRCHSDQEFQVDAVRMLNESGKPLVEVAPELEIG